jgi:dipeptidyl-peptidase-4
MKINKLLTFLIAFILLGGGVTAQKKELRLSDPYRNPDVYPDRISQLQWMTDRNEYTFVKDSSLMVATPEGEPRELMSLKTFRESFQRSGLTMPKRFPRMSWAGKNTLQMIIRDTIYHFATDGGKIVMVNKYNSKSEYIKIHPKTYDVAFTEGQNLFIYHNGDKIAVTDDKIPGVVNGQTVARSEFGITHGIFWSPSGKNLAFYHKDESMVTEYPLVDIDVRPAKVKNTRYPMAGMTSEEVAVMVYNLETKKTIRLKTGQPHEQYLTNVTWSPDDKYIFIAVINRDQNHMWLRKYDAQTGEFVKTLFEETNEKYVEPVEGLHFLNGSNDRFVWMSRRDGWNHAYLYNTEGELIKQLTKGDWLITGFIGFSPDNSVMYFMSTKESPIQNHLYSVSLKNGKVKKLTDVHGTHRISMSYDKSYFFDVFSNYNTVVRRYDLRSSAKGKLVKTLLNSRNPLKDYNLGDMTISTIKAGDGSDLYYRMIKPAGFDPSKKYPVIVYVYGGPHAQLVTDSWLGGGGFFLQYLATQGYVVFTLDNHGSANRGFAFESVIHRQLGQQEMKDQMKGIEFLKSKSWVDTNRIGVNGWSFGGFMTISLITNYPDVFKVAVAGGPVIDWKYYEVMYGERYMDRPQENPDGYSTTSLLPMAKNLQGHLLIIHGTMDPTVVWQNSLMFIKACVKAGKQVDYFVYPDHEHNVRGYDRLHLETKIFNYFQDYL